MGRIRHAGTGWQGGKQGTRVCLGGNPRATVSRTHSCSLFCSTEGLAQAFSTKYLYSDTHGLKMPSMQRYRWMKWRLSSR